MYNWSVDTSRLMKSKDEFDVFELEQMINYGLNNKKISGKKLKKHWDRLEIDQDKRRYLRSLLWPQKS